MAIASVFLAAAVKAASMKLLRQLGRPVMTGQSVANRGTSWAASPYSRQPGGSGPREGSDMLI